MDLNGNIQERASAIMTSDEARACWLELQNADRIVVTAHRSPDGDAVGSVMGLVNHLKSKGIHASPVFPDRFPSNLKWMPGTEVAQFHEENPTKVEGLLQDADILICLDFNGPSRTGGMEQALRESPAKKWVIDHHQNPEEFSDRLFSDPACGSTCELIFDLILGWGHIEEINQDTAVCIYTGIMTDTGSFRFPSVTVHTHEVLMHLLATGMNHASVHEQTFDQQSIDQVQLHGFAMSERLKVWPDVGLAMISLAQADLERFHYQPGDTEGLVNRALGLAGVRAAIFAKESHVGAIKLSFRSVGAIDVRAIAAANFDGGGHTNAAGGIYRAGTLDDLEALVEEQRRDWFGVI